ncbi:hypothetical protein ATANTOWER_032740, partial [Ataeniobius toweri]|nr:hypothetical protein [Ataeniobius toweri]
TNTLKATPVYPVPEEEKQPQSITDPLPCFTTWSPSMFTLCLIVEAEASVTAIKSLQPASSGIW